MAAKRALSSAVVYRDPMAALKWLEAAFGFETTLLIEDEAGNLAHSQMAYGDGLMTQTVHIQLADGEGTVDDHCERARKAGAVIIAEPDTQFYGDRTYRCKDPEGHIWTVAQTVEVKGPEDWHTANMGLKTTIYKA